MTGPAPAERVLVSPARLPDGPDRPVHFLFTLPQVEEFIRSAPVFRIPFAPSHVRGVTRWRDRVIPVISLEGCLGIPSGADDRQPRLMVVRTGESGLRGMVEIDAAVRIISLDGEFTPVPAPPWLVCADRVRGIYEWTEGFLVMVHIDAVLQGAAVATPEKGQQNTAVPLPENRTVLPVLPSM